MGSVSRLHARSVARRVFGADVESALLPVLAVGLAGSIAGGMLWSFIGIWAKERLEASDWQLGIAFLVGAVLAGAGGYVGGHLSDRYGRRRLILAGWGVQALVPLALMAAGGRTVLGLCLLAGSAVFGSIGHGADQALVADLVPPERQENAYAAVRVTNNLGVVIGPPLGGLLLLGESWDRLFVGASALAAVTFLIALRLIPRRGAYTPETQAEESSLRILARDRIFLLFFASGCLATLVYVTYETVLPISLVDTHDLEPSTWGFLLVLNPAMVALFQLRLTGRTAGVPASVKLSAAMLLMGLPFLALTVSSSLAVIAAVIFVFVIGEMLWVPTSQAVVARIAPPEVRGAYMGAFGATFAVGFALTPFIGLQVRGAAGDDAMWTTFAAISVLASAIGAVACRAAFGWRGTASAPLEAPT